MIFFFEGGLPKRQYNLEEREEDFYRVFLENMRDLGSPVHSWKLMRNVLDEFPDFSNILIDGPVKSQTSLTRPL